MGAPWGLGVVCAPVGLGLPLALVALTAVEIGYWLRYNVTLPSGRIRDYVR